MENNRIEPIVKVNLPDRLFVLRICAAVFLIFLILFKTQLEFILLYLIFLFAFIVSAESAKIEVYPDHFKLIRSGPFYKKFKEEEEYSYGSIREFEFEKSKWNLGAITLSFLFRGGTYYFYTPPSIMFKYIEGGITSEITRKFKYSKNDLIAAFEIIEKRVKSHTH